MSDTSTEVVVRSGGALAVGAEQTEWTAQQLAVLRSVGVDKDVLPAELTAFLHESQRTGLDPFSKQIYLIGRWDGREQRKVFRSQTGIDGYRVVAHRAARRDHVKLAYADTLWCGPGGAWRDVWLASTPPAAAKVVVYKDGDAFPGIATLNEYAAMDRNNNPTPMWRKMPATMLAKCAEALALRKAFPHDLSGIYTAEEMEQADARSAPHEVTVEQAAQQMRRNQGQQGADDPWMTPEPGEGTPDASTETPTDQMLQRIAILITGKFGALKRDDRLAHLSRMLGRKVASSRELSLSQARAVISDLEKLPDHIADAEVVPDEPVGTEPNPRNGDAGKPLDPALFVPSLQSLIVSARGEGGPSVADSLADLIGKASTPSVLERLFRVATEARSGEHITAEDFARLNAAGQAKDRELSGAATPYPPQPQSDAPGDLQYEAADSLAKRIRQTHKLDALNALHGTLTEARDGNRITAIQFATLERQMDERYQVLAKAAGMLPDQAGDGWSHRKLAQSGAAL